eukprot:6160068-Prymnesium_polylepis.1
MGTWHGDPGTDSVDATGVVLMMLCYLFVCVLSRVQSTGWVYVGCGMRMPSSGVSASCLRMCVWARTGAVTDLRLGADEGGTGCDDF